MSYQQDCINQLLPAAANVQIEIGLPGAVLIAQAIQETGYLRYVTSDKYTGKNSFNIFNIKWSGLYGYVTATTWEHINGRDITMDAKFRAYGSYQESFEDYTNLITGNSTYARAVAAKGDPVAYAKALQACGYATAPNYASSLIALMAQWNLIKEVQTFIDTPDDYAKAQWELCTSKGIFDGTNPKGALTREQLSVLLVKLGLVK